MNNARYSRKTRLLFPYLIDCPALADVLLFPASDVSHGRRQVACAAPKRNTSDVCADMEFEKSLTLLRFME